MRPPGLIWADRPLAAVGAWYELFPRSFGGLRGAAGQVPRLAGLGFDVLYLPPVHPIGHTFRKGRDNSLTAGPGDPGSPWAIGSEEGGHTALHPELGTFDDFDYLVRTAAGHGMEVALDYALNCTPDHPWVKEHPEWFHHRPDGSIAYAENPPKKYQDIYPAQLLAAVRNSPGGAVGSVQGDHRLLGRPGRAGFQGGQPPHQAVRLLGMAGRARCAGSAPTSSCWPKPLPGPK